MRTPPARRRAAARRVVALCAAVLTAAGLLAACSSDVPDAQSGSTSSTEASTTSSTSTTTTLPPTTTTTLPPTTTTEPIVTKGGVVKVANSSGVNGAAGFLTEELAKLGFETRKATNGAGVDEDLQVSKIYVLPGSEAVAKSISRLMGGIEVFPMPTPVWITGANEALEGATVVVMLGHDLAGTKLADMSK